MLVRFTNLFFTNRSIMSALYILATLLVFAVTNAKPAEEVAEENFFCPSDGLFRDPYNAHSFYQCINNEAFKFTCPDGLVFNSNSKVCDWEVDTGYCAGRPNGNYYVPYDDTKFYMCSNGRTYLMACPDSTYYRPSVNRCI
uniref:chondroitin proteoglycan-2-like n=1 Tax=Myxine glutinosa TaxID=7769 RepID=UPI00358F7254